MFIGYAVALSFLLARKGVRWNGGSKDNATAKEPSRVLVIGATGGTGRQLVKQALQRGYHVTALVRDPTRIDIVHPQLTVIQGDVLDATSVEKAMRDQQAVLSALGHKRWFYPARILSAGTRNILSAMRACGTKRLICETSLGIGDSAGHMGLYYTFFVIPLILPFYFWDKARQERLIEASGTDWVIVRPGVLTDRDKQRATRSGYNVGSFLLTPSVARADVAKFMLSQLTSSTYLHAAPGICGAAK